MKALLAWTARHAFLFVLLAIAIAVFQLGWAGATVDWLRGAGMTNSAQMAEHLADERLTAGREFERSASQYRQASTAQRTAFLRDQKSRLLEVEKALAREPGLFDSYHPQRVVERQILVIEQKTLKSEIAILEGLITTDALQNELSRIRVPTSAAITAADRKCRSANLAVRQFNDRTIRWEEDADRLTKAAKTECGRKRNLERRRQTGLERARTLNEQITKAETAIGQAERTGRETIAGYQTAEAKGTIGDILGKAAIALLAIIFMPLLIRTFFFYVLAPLAERRADIRIATPADGSAQITSASPSRVSVPITLREGEELLARQGYLQTHAPDGQKSTRWLFDYRHVLSSLASGLRFLTRIRGDGETTTVSAVQDPLAELAEVELPKGSACVLHPRSLVAVVQPVDQPIRIHSHWRLFSLNAWLTLQLRYLSFHGPGRLILSGIRGISVERAEQGRVFGQDQLVGFSADLAYSVTRTETFAPYLFGKESLFKDTVRQGSGILILEQAPLAARKGGGIRRGLEGTFDAFLKAFGL